MSAATLSRVAIGRRHVRYLYPLTETPAGHPDAVEGLGGLHGEFVRPARVPTPIYSADERKHPDVRSLVRRREWLLLETLSVRESCRGAARRKQVPLFSALRTRGGPEGT